MTDTYKPRPRPKGALISCNDITCSVVKCNVSCFVSVDAGLQHRVLLPPDHQIFHFDRTVAAEIVELTC